MRPQAPTSLSQGEGTRPAANFRLETAPEFDQQFDMLAPIPPPRVPETVSCAVALFQRAGCA